MESQHTTEKEFSANRIERFISGRLGDDFPRVSCVFALLAHKTICAGLYFQEFYVTALEERVSPSTTNH